MPQETEPDHDDACDQRRPYDVELDRKPEDLAVHMVRDIDVPTGEQVYSTDHRVIPPEDGRDHAREEGRLVQHQTQKGTEAHGGDEEQQGKDDRRRDTEPTECARRQWASGRLAVRQVLQAGHRRVTQWVLSAPRLSPTAMPSPATG